MYGFKSKSKSSSRPLKIGFVAQLGEHEIAAPAHLIDGKAGIRERIGAAANGEPAGDGELFKAHGVLQRRAGPRRELPQAWPRRTDRARELAGRRNRLPAELRRQQLALRDRA